MMNEPIPFIDLKSELAANEAAYVEAFTRVLRSGHFILGPEVSAFEAEAADFLGCKHAVGVSNGTDALVLALRAAGVGPGDEVITTAFTFYATAESIQAIGAVPRFVDIDPRTLLLDASLVEAAITPQTRAILPVHIFGQAAPMRALENIAADHELVLVEDVAQAFGAQEFPHRGGPPQRSLGNIGRANAFSFFPTKMLGSFGDAGLVTTNDNDVADTLRALRAHGSRKKYFNEMVGYNARLDAVQAAMLRIRLNALPAQLTQRAKAVRAYDAALNNVDGITVVGASNPNRVLNYYTIQLRSADRAEAQAQLKALGVASMVYYPIPLHRLPAVTSDPTWHPVSLPVTESACGNVLSLPFWPGISESTIARVAECIRQVV